MKQADRQALKTVRDAAEAARRAQISQFSRTVKGWGQTWRAIRLRCPGCDAYLVYSRRVKFAAFCTNKCGFMMQRSKYLSLKSIAVQHALLGYDFPEDVPPYFFVEKAA